MAFKEDSKEQMIFSRLLDIIKFIEECPLNASGVKVKLEEIVKPEGKKPRFKGAIPEIYQDILEFYNSIPYDINQTGALIMLRVIKEKYSSSYRL